MGFPISAGGVNMQFPEHNSQNGAGRACRKSLCLFCALSVKQTKWMDGVLDNPGCNLLDQHFKCVSRRMYGWVYLCMSALQHGAITSITRCIVSGCPQQMATDPETLAFRVKSEAACFLSSLERCEPLCQAGPALTITPLPTCIFKADGKQLKGSNLV